MLDGELGRNSTDEHVIKTGLILLKHDVYTNEVLI